MKKLFPRLRRPLLGRRGTILLLLGACWVLIGIGTFVSPLSPSVASLLHAQVPKQINAVFWVSSGIIASIYAFRKDDAIGFLSLYIMPAFYAFSYFLGWLDFLSPFVGGNGHPWGWFSAVFFLIELGVVIVCAGWPESSDILEEIERTHGNVAGEDEEDLS